jgi:hypothetical protein
MPGTLAAIVAVMLLAAAAHAEEGPSRAEYVTQVEPICEQNTKANKRILKGARTKVKKGMLPVAGKQFLRASRAFGQTVRRIVAVPRPGEDDARLQKWFKFLRIVQANLRKIGTALKKKDRVLANHEAIRAERSANAANNVSAIFSFRYCKLTPNRFSGT